MKPAVHDGRCSKLKLDQQPVLCVFPNDTLAASFNKGEVKERYFNPSNLFREIQVISLASHDIDPTKVQRMFGNANVVLHCIGPKSLFGRIFRRFAPELYYLTKLKDFLSLASNIKPCVIRAYNPILQGFLATYIGKRLKVPTVVSVHASHDYDAKFLSPKRILFWARRKPAKALFDLYALARFQVLGKAFEKLSLESASQVVCAYRFPKEIVKKYRGGNVSLIYNRVDTDRFKPYRRSRKGRIVILHVGVLTYEKNPENLVRAIANLPVKLRITGDGELRKHLNDLVNKLGIADKVQFIYRTDHVLIHELYAEADIFVMCMKVGGISIPILEAMASGLPIVFTRGIYEREKEVVNDVGICVEDDPDEIARALYILIKDRRLRQRLGRKARERIQQINAEKMEQLEAALYKRLMT